MFSISFPTSYILGIYQGMGLPGLWIGYGFGAFCLAILYSGILLNLNWNNQAEIASKDEL